MTSFLQIRSNTTLLSLGAILLFTLIAFGGTLRGGFLWDDHEMIVNNRYVRGLSAENVRHLLTHDAFEGTGNAYYRPLQTLSNLVDYSLWGLRPFGFHLTNLAMHGLNALLFFLILRRGRWPQEVPWAAAVALAVHPVVVEQLLIVAGRAELMAMNFTLLALWWRGKDSWVSDVGAALCCALACFSKESGVVAPILALWAAPERSLKKQARFLVPSLSLVAVYLLIRQSVISESPWRLSGMEFLTFFWREAPAIFVSYLRLLAWPLGLHSHHRMVFSEGYLWASALGLLLAVGFWGWRHPRSLLAGGGWFILAMVPKIPLLATNALMLDHWAYLSSVSFHVGAAWVGWNSRWPRVRLRRLLWCGWIMLLIGLSQWNTVTRLTDQKMYETSLRHPSSSVVRSNLGGLYYHQGRYQDALDLAAASLAMNPSDTALQIQALSLWKLGRREEALQALRPRVDQPSPDLMSLVNLGLITGGREGQSWVKEALRRDPSSWKAWRTLGDLQVEQKDFSGALDSFQKSLDLAPWIAELWDHRGFCQASLGRYEEAEISFQEALKRDPALTTAQSNLKLLARRRPSRLDSRHP